MIKKKILIVDDSKFMRDMLIKAMLKLGFEVIAAENGNVAIAQYRQHAPDLVITDLIMPECDGLSFLKAIIPSEAGLPVIVLTSDRDIYLKAEVIAQGVRAFMRKPVHMEKIARKALQLIGAP